LAKKKKEGSLEKARGAPYRTGADGAGGGIEDQFAVTHRRWLKVKLDSALPPHTTPHQARSGAM
jgi:hypothetical protein